MSDVKGKSTSGRGLTPKQEKFCQLMAYSDFSACKFLISSSRVNCKEYECGRYRSSVRI